MNKFLAIFTFLCLFNIYLSQYIPRPSAFATSCINEKKPTPLPTFYRTFPTGLSATVSSLFPESKTPNPALISTEYPVSLNFTSTSYLNVTFLDEGAGYRNTLGYYLINPDGTISKFSMFPDFSRESDSACLIIGDTVRVGPFPANTTLGFYLIANGFNKTDSAYINDNTWLSFQIPPNFVNSDGFRHSAWVNLVEYNVSIVGFEDLRNLGDKDYNDALFSFTIDGTSSTKPPNYENGTIYACTSSFQIKPIEFNCVQWSLLETTSPLACQGFINIPVGWGLATEAEAVDVIVAAGLSEWSYVDGLIIVADGIGYFKNATKCTGPSCSASLKFLQDTGSTCISSSCTNRILLKGAISAACYSTSFSYCDPNINARTIGSFPDNNLNSIIFPTKQSIYLNSQSSIPVQISSKIPQKSSPDFFIIVDCNANQKGAIEELIKGIFASASSIVPSFETPTVGVGCVSTTGSLSVLSALGTSSSRNLNFPSNGGIGIDHISAAVIAMNSSNIGWRPSAYRTVIISTTVSPVASQLASLRSISISKNIVPIFINPNATANNLWNSLFSTLPFSGYGSNTDDNYKSLNSKIVSITRALSLNLTYVASTGIDLIRSLPDSSNLLSVTQGNGVSTSTNSQGVTFYTYNTTAVVGFSSTQNSTNFSPVPYTTSILVFGYDYVTYSFFWNRSPAFGNVNTFSVVEDTPTNIEISAVDLDKNLLDFTILTLPSHGSLYSISSGSIVSAGDKVTSGKFTYTPGSNIVTTTTFTAKISDRCLESPSQVITLTIIPVNDPPVAQSFTVTTNEDTSVTISFTNRVSDNEDAASVLSIVLNSVPSSGTLTTVSSIVPLTSSSILGTQRSIIFTPPKDFSGSTSFAYTVSDTNRAQSSGTVTINVNPVNDAPIVSLSSQITGNRLSTVPFTVRITDIDSSTAYLIISNTYSALSTHTITQNSFTLNSNTPLPYTTSSSTTLVSNIVDIPFIWNVGNNINSPTITFVAVDFSGLYSAPQNITLRVAPNRAPTPVIISTTSTFNEDSVSNVITLNATDVDANDYITLTITIIDIPITGTLRIGTNNIVAGSTFTLSNSSVVNTKTSSFIFTYNTLPNSNADSKFTYRFTDRYSATSTISTHNIIINPVNDPPTSSNFTVTTNEDTPVIINTFSATDIDSPDSELILNIVSTVNPLLGSLTFNNAPVSNGLNSFIPWSFTYTPTADGSSVSAYDTFTFKICDATLCSTSNYVVTIFVNPANDAPVARDFTITTNEDTAVDIPITNFISDIDSPNISLEITIDTIIPSTFGILNDQTTIVTASYDLGYKNMTFTPATNINGTVSFKYTVRDPSGLTDSAIITIIVLPINDAPVLSIPYNIIVGKSLVGSSFLVSISDVDIGDSVRLEVIAVTTFANHSLAYSTANITSSSSLPFQMLASTNTVNNIFTISVNWIPTYFNNATVTFIAYDSANLASNSQIVNLTPAINENPTLVSFNNSIITYEDTTSSIVTVVGNDIDVGDYLFIKITTPPLYGTIVDINNNPIVISSPISLTGLPANFTFYYKPDLNYNGPDIIKLLFLDKNSASSPTATIPVTVIPMNDAPTTNDITIYTSEDTFKYFDSIPFSDIDGDIPNLIILSLPYGDLTTQADQVTKLTVGTNLTYPYSLVYYPPSNKSSDIVFTTFDYKVCDLFTCSSNHTATIFVSPVNDAPYAEDIQIVLNEDTQFVINFTSYISDIDNQISDLTIKVNPPSGLFGYIQYSNNNVISLTDIGTTRTVTYITNSNTFGNDSFTYSVYDLGGLSASATVYITINPTNDPPVIFVPVSYFQAYRGTNASITVSASDIDPNDYLKLSFQSVLNNQLNSHELVGTSASLTPSNLNNLPTVFYESIVDSNGLISTTLTWKVSNNILGATFSVVATDFSLAMSSIAEIVLSILPNRAPFIINNPTTLTTNEDTTLNNIVLAGDDYDLPDWNNLGISFTTLPTRGALYLNNILITNNTVHQNRVVDSNSHSSNFTVSYVPATNYNGQDSFSYTYSDNFGGISSPEIVAIIINPTNDPPVSSDINIYTVEDTSVQISSLIGSDIDGDNLVLIINTTVNKGTLKDNNQQIIFNDRVLNYTDSWVLTFDPLFNENSVNTPYTYFTFQVCDSLACSPLYTALIFVTPVNDPPIGASKKLTINEDEIAFITLDAYDYEDQTKDLTFAVVGLGSSNIGTFYSDPQLSVVLNPSDTFNNVDLFYQPPPNAHGDASAPLATLDFKIIDSGLLESPVYTISIYVISVNDNPEYLGSTNFTTYEDLPLALFLTSSGSYFDDNGEICYIEVLSSPAKGTLLTCDADDNCTVPAYPSIITHPQSKLIYSPVSNDYGMSYATLNLALHDQSGGVTYININIDVIPVNDKPVIELVSFISIETGTNSINEDTYMDLVWVGHDQDNFPSELVTKITVSQKTKNGFKFLECTLDVDNNCVPTNNSFNKGNTISSPIPLTISKSSSCPTTQSLIALNSFESCQAIWTMRFIPDADKFSYQYIQFSLKVVDPEGAESNTKVIIIAVLPVNDAPVINSPSYINATSGDLSPFIVLDTDLGRESIIISDIDANPDTVILTIEFLNSSIAEPIFPETAQPACVKKERDSSLDYTVTIDGAFFYKTYTYYQCEDIIDSFNMWLTSLRIKVNENKTTAYVLLTVNDKGHNGEVYTELSDQSLTIVQVNPLPSVIGGDNSGGSNVLTIAAASAGVAGAVILGAAAWRLSNLHEPPADDYFAQATSPLEASPTNPLYKSPIDERFSPLYKS